MLDLTALAIALSHKKGFVGFILIPLGNPGYMGCAALPHREIIVYEELYFKRFLLFLATLVS
jgi:hypothetical protein